MCPYYRGSWIQVIIYYSGTQNGVLITVVSLFKRLVRERFHHAHIHIMWLHNYTVVVKSNCQVITFNPCILVSHCMHFGYQAFGCFVSTQLLYRVGCVRCSVPWFKTFALVKFIAVQWLIH